MKIVKVYFHAIPFGSFRSVKSLNFEPKLPIWTAHHNFLESKHPEVTKNPHYVLLPLGSQKRYQLIGLYVIIESNPWNITLNEGATKLYFIHCLHVFIVLFSTGLYKSAFSTYTFGNLGFCSSIFWFFMFLYLWFLAFIFLFYVLNSMSFLIMLDLITFFNFLLTLFK